MVSIKDPKAEAIERFKRAMAVTTRSIAQDSTLEIEFVSTEPTLVGKTAKIPEIPQKTSRKGLAELRGYADSVALRAACHDQALHAKLAPSDGPARPVFDAAERTRVEALGALRMKGVAFNLKAKLERKYRSTQFAPYTDEAVQAPLADALSFSAIRWTGTPGF